MLPRECWPANVEPLPGLAGEIEEIIGRAPTLRLIGSLPPAGKRPWRRVIYVPYRVEAGHPLREILGDLTEVFVYHFGGQCLQPPNCAHLERRHRARCVVEMGAQDIPAVEIADCLGLSAYRVREILREKPPENAIRVPGQMPARDFAAQFSAAAAV